MTFRVGGSRGIARGWCAAAVVLAAACSGKGDAPIRDTDGGAGDGGATLDGSAGDGGGSADSAPSCTPPPAATSATYVLRYDQLGYLTNGDAWAIVLSQGAAAPSIRVYDAATGCAVSDAATAGPRLVDTTSRAGTKLTADRVDLSMIRAPGKYYVVVDGARFGPIAVGDDVYKDVLPTIVGFLRAQRCGATTMDASHHGACHLYASLSDADAKTSSGDGVAVDDGTTGTITAASGPPVDVEGGFHDAGDYIKFVGTTAFTLAVDLLALRDHAAAFARPEAGAIAAGIKAEMRWGLDWLLKMVGGTDLYHQVSGDKDHDPAPRVPEADTAAPIPGYAQRPVFRFAPAKGANLLGRSAAAFALGSVVFAADPAYAAKLLAAAKSVYAAAPARLLVQNPDPADFYQETSLHDDLAFGAAVLAQVTGTPSYAAEALVHARTVGTAATPAKPLYWGDVRSLGILETALAFPDGSAERKEMAAGLTSLATPMLQSNTAPAGPAAAYRYALPTLDNGTIEESLGAAAVCLAARRLGGSDACDEVARSQLHWMLGLNPFGVSFVIGLGTAYPQHPQHAWSQATNLPITGAIVGGPTGMTVLRDVHTGDTSLKLPTAESAFAPFSTDDLVYDDDATNYVVNEPALDFTAPLVFVLGELLDPRK